MNPISKKRYTKLFHETPALYDLAVELAVSNTSLILSKEDICRHQYMSDEDVINDLIKKINTALCIAEI